MARNDLVENAGRFVGRHAMVWTRGFDVPVEQVWEAISTKDGLDKWWITPVEIDLRVGGLFSHHWENTILDLKECEFIDFGGMRFEIKAVAATTVFSLLDVWQEDAVPPGSELSGRDAVDTVQPGGPGTPWSGVAGGWHCAIDDLETHLTGKAFEHSFEDRARFYADYLTDHFRLLAYVSSDIRRE